MEQTGFYNISESPAYADAVANAAIDGVSFQWYPTGLVANRSLKGNYLPNVDVYKIPFGDTIAAYRNKAMMVYEFDAGDVADSYMYPAMARSFRSAGFQWATQFAYDPMATAYGNTEYQTHYLNLAYTPSKAISLLIASKVFHRLPRLKSFGTYPEDTTMQKPAQGKMMVFQTYFADKILGRKSELNNFKTLVLRAKAGYNEPVQMKLALLTKDAQALATYLTLTDQFKEIEIPLTALMADSSLLLPRPYPCFLPLWFKSSSNAPFNLTDAEKLEVSFVSTGGKHVNIQIESVYLKK